MAPALRFNPFFRLTLSGKYGKIHAINAVMETSRASETPPGELPAVRGSEEPKPEYLPEQLPERIVFQLGGDGCARYRAGSMSVLREAAFGGK